MGSTSDLPPLYALQAFLAAASAGSFSRAAEAMHLTQGAISRQIQLLEDFYGCPLFVRKARGIALTSEGAELLPVVEEALRALRNMTTRVRQSTTILTLRLPPTFAMRWFAPRMPAIREALPGIELRIATQWERVPEFGQSDADAIVAYGTGDWPDIVKVPLMRETLTPMCAPSMRSTLKRVADLEKATLLHGSAQLGNWATWFGKADRALAARARNQVLGTLDLCLSAAMRGQGVAIADPAMLSELLQDGVLVTPFARRVDSGMSYFLTYPEQRSQQRKIAALQTWLLGQFEVPSAGTKRRRR